MTRAVGEDKGGGCWANKFSHCFLCAICRQRGGAMAAKEEAVEEEREERIGEGKIEREEEDPSERTKIDGARDIDSYTHYIYTHKMHI